MRMKKLVSQAKKYAKAWRARKARRTRVVVLSGAIVGALIAVVGAARFGSPAHDAPMSQEQRVAENRRAAAELAAPAADYAAATSAPAAAAAKTPPVTLTGCLAQHDDAFQLKDVGGADAPRARSWKSGFLKARTAPIAVVDGGRLKLQDHVGERVAVTGVLNDREIEARSIKGIANSCSD